ncbi:STAS domain-containing protein [Cognatazoarcus halotolerans]|uniref:STAS domain-containing protein n=1 Tax=Cognatazoarcus halotolerans TaxID=2686016 RepID=UPI00135B8A1A|nr:STAS domain-containing protein [Cognatazoarcus halotolerans]MCB1900136.1 STAS domain-containing protein [Rhodocyclaceae bacterium]MCP5311319.1 STAS domain-containing protein [Zoogloeaceae bacterium]
METVVDRVNGEVVIRLNGRFDFNAHRDFREAVETALASSGNGVLKVDLENVAYLDSSALGMLLMLRDKARTASRTVVLSQAKGSVRQVLEIANFAKLFSITD